MEIEEFYEKMLKKAEKLNINLEEEQINKFFCYMNLLIEKNKVMNLTNITNPDDIILKHFIDSLTISKFIEKRDKIIDIGTGAGFPGIPIKIEKAKTEIYLVDSLNKRIKFLEEVIKNLNIKQIVAIHSRAEEMGKNINYREKFDVAVSRAVAPLNTLVEYLIPFVKIGGKCICMKGNNLEEIKNAKKAIKILGGEIENIEKLQLPDSDNNRTIIVINKIKNTPKLYPRKAGEPSKRPL